MELTEAMILAAISAGSVMGVTWLLSLPLRDASIVDVVWGLGYVVVAWVLYLSAIEATTRGLLVVVLVTVWGLRLTGHLAWRNIGTGEDFRYREMRERRGSAFPVASLFTVFALQGAIMWVVSLPVQAAIASETDVTALDWIGAAIWTVGFLFEAVGDAQLARFKADPANTGKVMDRGLWRYTRHPNYFGDFCVWWGIYLVALGAEAWWTAVGPLAMSVLLMRYSGVGLLERTIPRRRPGYEEYAARTNAFFPGPPKA